MISATDGAANQTYYTYDGLGSTTDLTDGSSNVTGAYSYDVFGAVRSQTGGGSNYWQFTGEQRDADSSAYYLRARYYDPAIGRFLGRDQLPTGNLYAYVGNNPVNLVDPSGQCVFGLPCPKPIQCVLNGLDCIENPVSQAVSCLRDPFKCTYNLRSRLTRNLENILFATSPGDVTDKEGGIRVVQNCTGSCAEFLKAVGQGAFTIGHTIFTIGTFEGDRGQRTLAHEKRHVRQYEILGDFFLPFYVGPGGIGALVACAAAGDISSDCLHDRNLFELLAD